jgi:hypothetical protein
MLGLMISVILRTIRMAILLCFWTVRLVFMVLTMCVRLVVAIVRL